MCSRQRNGEPINQEDGSCTKVPKRENLIECIDDIRKKKNNKTGNQVPESNIAFCLPPEHNRRIFER